MRIGEKETLTITFTPEESGVRVQREMLLSDDITSLAMVDELVAMAKYLLQIIPLKSGDEKLKELKAAQNNRNNEVFSVVEEILNKHDEGSISKIMSKVCFGATALTNIVKKYCDMLNIEVKGYTPNNSNSQTALDILNKLKKIYEEEEK
jgi:predicted HAD superfamily phosphohydrolase